MLEDFLTEKRCVSSYPVRVFTRYEAYGEKIRAALTRTQPAIRDFYDIHYAYKHDLICLSDPTYINIVRDKLSVPEVGPVNLSDKKLEQLKAQIATELSPTLRMREVELVDFDLKKVFDLLDHFVKTSLSGLI